jgi:hypothetical protein
MLNEAKLLIGVPLDADWMPPTIPINARTVVTRRAFDSGSRIKDMIILFKTIFGPLYNTVLDRVAPAIFEREHGRREFLVLSGKGKEGKSLFASLLKMLFKSLVVPAEALKVGARGLTGNNESWHKAKDAAIAITEEVAGKLDGNAYKELSGGNGVSISCSLKYGHEIESIFRGLIILLTNNDLEFEPFDDALKRRLVAVQMPSKFVSDASELPEAYGSKAYVRVYAAFAEDKYVEKTIAADDLYKCAILAVLRAHYELRKGQYAQVESLYDLSDNYAAQNSGNTPHCQWLSFWEPDPRDCEERTCKELYDIMVPHVQQGAKGPPHHRASPRVPGCPTWT